MAASPIVDALRRLSVAVVADVLDRLGSRQQVMRSTMRPRTVAASCAGIAFTALAQPAESIEDEPYEREIAAVDAIPAGAVFVLAAPGCSEVGCWGELLGTRAAQRGAVGAVIDAGIRDLVGLRRLGLPVFATAISANDSRGRSNVVSHGQPVECAGVRVATGDFVLADPDGVVVVPAAIAADTIARAIEKRDKESLALEMLREGASVADAWDRHRVL